MGTFSDEVQDLVEAFDDLEELGDVVEKVTYRQNDKDHKFRAIPSAVEAYEADGEAVKITDTKWLFLPIELKRVIPVADDWIVDCSGHEQQVIHVKKHPGKLLWEVFARG